MAVTAVAVRAGTGVSARWVRVRGGDMYTRFTVGAPPGGPPIVLVHGLVVSSRYMAPLLRELAPLRCAYAPDLPGYGKSDKPWPILDLQGLADMLAAWMDALGIVRAHLVGNSMGCQVIAQFALQHRARVQRLVLQGPTVDAAARSLPRQLWRIALNSRREPRHSLGWVSLRDYRAAGLRRAYASMRLALADRIEDKLPRIDAPTLIVRGRRDPLVPQRWAERLRDLLPHGRLHVMCDLPHTINYAAPAPFVRVIRPFLEL